MKRKGNQEVPKANSRAFWKGLTNKHGRAYGTHAKGHGVKQPKR